MRVIPVAPRIVRARPFDRCVARVRSDHQLNRRVRHSSVFLMYGAHGRDDRVRTSARPHARLPASARCGSTRSIRWAAACARRMLREPDSSSSSAGHESVAQPADAMHAPCRTQSRGRPAGRIVNVPMLRTDAVRSAAAPVRSAAGMGERERSPMTLRARLHIARLHPRDALRFAGMNSHPED